MKLGFFLGVGLLVLPAVAEAQLEVGFDSGVTVERGGGSSQTTFEIPSGWLRIGFSGQAFTFESLFTLAWARASGQSASVVEFLPGIAYRFRGNTYVRGEVGVLLFSAAGESASQFAYGVSVGTKRQIGPGPLYLRLETGLDQWEGNNDFRERSEFRGSVGLSVVLN